jgi:hypothetical protein
MIRNKGLRSKRRINRKALRSKNVNKRIRKKSIRRRQRRFSKNMVGGRGGGDFIQNGNRSDSNRLDNMMGWLNQRSQLGTFLRSFYDQQKILIDASRQKKPKKIDEWKKNLIALAITYYKNIDIGRPKHIRNEKLDTMYKLPDITEADIREIITNDMSQKLKLFALKLGISDQINP